MKNRLAKLSAPELIHHHVPQNASNVGIVERAATNEKLPMVRVMSSIQRAAIGGFEVTTVIQYALGQQWIIYSREWTGELQHASVLAYRESRKAFKTAVSRAFAASLHSDVYVPDTDDIDC